MVTFPLLSSGNARVPALAQQLWVKLVSWSDDGPAFYNNEI